MRALFITLFLFLPSSHLIISADAQNLTEKKVESIKNELDTLFQEMLVYARRLDYDNLNSGVDDKHAAGFITNGKYYSQYVALIADIKDNAQGVSRQDISIKEQNTTVLSDKIVLMTVSGTSRATLTDNREIVVGFHWSFVYEKIDNNWKVIHSHQSREL